MSIGAGLMKLAVAVPAIRPALLLVVLGLAPSPAKAQAPLKPEAVTINTDLTVFSPPVAIENQTAMAAPVGSVPVPFGAVILLTHGNGLLSLDGAGNITGPTGSFLIRSANEFMRRGLHVMIPDSAPAFPAGMNFTDRLSGTHASHLQGYINAAAARWRVPVWVAGNGNGGISAVTAAGFTPALTGYAGILLAAPVTNLTNNPSNQTLYNTYVTQMTRPTIVAWHSLDNCSFSPAAGSSSLFTSLPVTNKSSAIFNGGHAVAADPCGAFAGQGFAGEEAAVVGDLAAFVKTNSGNVKIPMATPAMPPVAVR